MELRSNPAGSEANEGNCFRSSRVPCRLFRDKGASEFDCPESAVLWSARSVRYFQPGCAGFGSASIAIVPSRLTKCANRCVRVRRPRGPIQPRAVSASRLVT